MSTKNTETTANTGIIQKVLDFITGGDEGKLKRFFKYYKKDNAKQIAIRKDELESAKDELAEIKETAAEALLNVNVDSISDLASAKEYVDEYRNTQLHYKKMIKNVEERIDSLKEDIKMFTELNADIA